MPVTRNRSRSRLTRERKKDNLSKKLLITSEQRTRLKKKRQLSLLELLLRRKRSYKDSLLLMKRLTTVKQKLMTQKQSEPEKKPTKLLELALNANALRERKLRKTLKWLALSSSATKRIASPLKLKPNATTSSASYRSRRTMKRLKDSKKQLRKLLLLLTALKFKARSPRILMCVIKISLTIWKRAASCEPNSMTIATRLSASRARKSWLSVMPKLAISIRLISRRRKSHSE